MNGKGIIYLAGPVAAATEAEVDANIEQAKAWTLKLIKLGYAVYSPVLYGIAREDKDTGWQDFMKNHLTILKALAVHGNIRIGLLPGWETSKGVSIEVFNAEAYHGISVIKVEELISDHVVENDTDLRSSDTKMGSNVLRGVSSDKKTAIEVMYERTSSLPTRCWCGKALEVKGMPDFLGDKVEEMEVCTMHYECKEHGQDYLKSPKTFTGIAISGKSRAGKSALAEMLKDRLDSGWRIESISDAVLLEWMKQHHPDFYAANGPNLSLEWADKQKVTDPTVRPQLIEIGQRRRAENPNYWLERLNCNAGAIVPNCRFDNEWRFFKERGFLMVRIEADIESRTERGAIDSNDPSETELDNIPFYKWGYWLDNNGSDLEYLGYEADNIVEIINKTGEVE